MNQEINLRLVRVTNKDKTKCEEVYVPADANFLEYIQSKISFKLESCHIQQISSFSYTYFEGLKLNPPNGIMSLQDFKDAISDGIDCSGPCHAFEPGALEELYKKIIE